MMPILPCGVRTSTTPGIVLGSAREAGDVLELWDTDGFELRLHRLRVIDDMVGAKLAAPLASLRAGGGGDDGESGELASQLDEDGADAAGAADDEDRCRCWYCGVGGSGVKTGGGEVG